MTGDKEFQVAQLVHVALLKSNNEEKFMSDDDLKKTAVAWTRKYFELSTKHLKMRPSLVVLNVIGWSFGDFKSLTYDKYTLFCIFSFSHAVRQAGEEAESIPFTIEEAKEFDIHRYMASKLVGRVEELEEEPVKAVPNADTLINNSATKNWGLGMSSWILIVVGSFVLLGLIIFN